MRKIFSCVRSWKISLMIMTWLLFIARPFVLIKEECKQFRVWKLKVIHGRVKKRKNSFFITPLLFVRSVVYTRCSYRLDSRKKRRTRELINAHKTLKSSSLWSARKEEIYIENWALVLLRMITFDTVHSFIALFSRRCLIFAHKLNSLLARPLFGLDCKKK